MAADKPTVRKPCSVCTEGWYRGVCAAAAMRWYTSGIWRMDLGFQAGKPNRIAHVKRTAGIPVPQSPCPVPACSGYMTAVSQRHHQALNGSGPILNEGNPSLQDGSPVDQSMGRNPSREKRPDAQKRVGLFRRGVPSFSGHGRAEAPGTAQLPGSRSHGYVVPGTQ